MPTTDTIIQGFPESETAARKFAGAAGLAFEKVALHHFPDGESLVRVAAAAETTILYRSLDAPNAKLVELMLAASALRAAGVRRLVLVAPYLCYMRQDRAFHDGEAISQRAVCGFLDGIFDAVVTVDPHLHRTRSLADVFPSARAIAVSATGLLATRLSEKRLSDKTLLLGPDQESRQWVEAVARPLDLPVLVGRKQRTGDRTVTVDIPHIDMAADRPVVIVDDVVSTGMTVAESARRLVAAGAGPIEVLTVHMLGRPADVEMLHAAGVSRIESSDSVPHETNTVALAPLLASAVKELLR